MRPDFHLAPSILSADFTRLGEQLHELEECGCGAVHIDVMDGSFVPNISFGMPVIRSIRPCTQMVFDVHMMVDEPARFVAEVRDAGADMITVHAEACRHLDRTLEEIRQTGAMAGVALNPATPVSELRYILDRVDMVLLMTVNPGFGGQSYIPAMSGKIRDTREVLDSLGYPDIPIEVDGGINRTTVGEVRKAGAEIIVAGSAVFRGDLKENARWFLKES